MLALDAQGARIEDQHALDDILEFAHVAGPVVVGQRFERFFADLHARAAVLAAKLGQKLARQQRNVLLALAQRRHKKRNHVEAIEEIFAEVALGDLFFEILVGGGDEAHIDAQGLRAADRREQLVVEGAEHLGLGFEAHVADFVEEERSAVGALEGAALLRRSAGLRAVAIAEELGLDVRLGNGGAVELDEDAVAAQALGVNGAGDEFLAGARFAVDEDAAVGGRHEANLLAQRLDAARFRR